MMRKIKALGVAFIAVFAMSAVAASAAHAAMEGEEFFHSHVNLAAVHPDSFILTGEQLGNHVFTPKPGGAAVTCKKAKFEGTEEVTQTQSEHEINHTDGVFTHQPPLGNKTLTNTSSTVTPTYSECEAFGGAATVTTTECHYRLVATTNESSLGASEIKCSGTKKITVEAAGCKLEIGSQTPTGGVNYENNKTGSTNEWDIKAKSAVTGISFNTNGAFACTLAGIPKEGKEGTYSGEVTIKGFEDEEPSITGTYHEGSQLGIWKGPTI